MTTVLAEVKHRIETFDGTGTPFALLTPLYIASSDSWSPAADIERQFPNNGEVVWWNPPSYVQDGSVFKVALVKVEVTDERHAAFRVDGEEQPFYEFVDMRGEPDAVELRRKLASGGFTFSNKPVGRQLLRVDAAGDEWVGPLELDFHQNLHSRWESGPASSSGFVATRSVSDNALQDIVIDDVLVKCLRPAETLGGPIGKFSAQTDQQLIESLLKRLRKIDSKAAAALKITKDVFHSYVNALTNAKLIDDQNEIEHVREEALQLLMAKLDTDAVWAEAAASSLVDHPKVTDQLAAAIQAEISRRVERLDAEAKEVATDLEIQVSKKQAKLEELDTAFSAKEAKLTEVTNQLVDKNASLREVSEDAAGQLSLLVDEVLADPVKELGKNALIRALTGSSGLNQSPAADGQLELDGGCYKALDECLGALDMAAQVCQQSQRSLQVCLSALLSGRPVVVVGAHSDGLLSTFCSVIAKQHAGKVNVPTDIFSLSDFFRLPVSPLIADGFPPCNLAEYFGQANKLGVCFPIVLVGANRAPMETALLDILLGPSALSTSQIAVQCSRTTAKLDKIAVERTAFFMTTLASGESVFCPHPDFLRTALFVDSDRTPADPFPGGSNMDLPAMSLSALSVNDWLDEGLEISNNAITTLVDTPNWLDGDFGTLREISIFCQVFRNEAVGLAEWLVAKYGRSLPISELLSLAQGCGGKVETALEGILEDVDIESISRAGGDAKS